MKVWKKVISVCLMLALVVTLVPVTKAEAKNKTTKDTLLVGEKVTYSIYGGKIKSVSTSKKSVATVKKSGYKVIVTAKKKGSATVKIKTTSGTLTYKLTIKTNSFSYSMKKMTDGGILVTIKNNSGVYMDSAKFQYTLKTADGAVVESDTVSVYYMIPGKLAYARIYYNKYSFDPDVSRCTLAMIDHYRNLTSTYKYTNRTSSIKYSVNTSGSSNTITFTNSSKVSVSGSVAILYKDAAGNVIDYDSASLYLSANGVYTKNLYPPTGGYASIQVIPRAYSMVRK